MVGIGSSIWPGRLTGAGVNSWINGWFIGVLVGSRGVWVLIFVCRIWDWVESVCGCESEPHPDNPNVRNIPRITNLILNIETRRQCLSAARITTIRSRKVTRLNNYHTWPWFSVKRYFYVRLTYVTYFPNPFLRDRGDMHLCSSTLGKQVMSNITCLTALSALNIPDSLLATLWHRQPDDR